MFSRTKTQLETEYRFPNGVLSYHTQLGAIGQYPTDRGLPADLPFHTKSRGCWSSSCVQRHTLLPYGTTATRNIKLPFPEHSCVASPIVFLLFSPYISTLGTR